MSRRPDRDRTTQTGEVDPPLIRQNENEKKISSVRNMFVVKLFKISKESCDYFYVSGFKPSYLDESLTFFVTVFVCSEVFDFDRLSTSSHQQWNALCLSGPEIMCYTMLWCDAQSWTQFIQPNAEFEGSALGHEAEQRKKRTAQVSENYSVVTADVVIDTDLNQFRAQLVKVNLSWY